MNNISNILVLISVCVCIYIYVMASFHTIRNLRNNYGGEYNNDDQNNYKSDFQNRDFYENICKLKRYKTVKALKK